jgi:hypothetical protein
MVVNKQVEDIVEFFKKIFNIDSSTAKKAKAQSGGLYNKIKDTQSKLDQINSIEPILIGIILILKNKLKIYVTN